MIVHDPRIVPFAGELDVEDCARDLLAELRRELLREARFLLREWERFGSDETLGRLLQALDDLALVVRGGHP